MTMTNINPVIWFASSVFAVALHGGAILGFSSLVRQPSATAQTHIQFAPKNILATTVSSQTTLSHAIAANSNNSTSAVKSVAEVVEAVRETIKGPLVEKPPERGAITSVAPPQVFATQSVPVRQSATASASATGGASSPHPENPVTAEVRATSVSYPAIALPAETSAANVTVADISESPAKPAVALVAETSVASVTVADITESPAKPAVAVAKATSAVSAATSMANVTVADISESPAKPAVAVAEATSAVSAATSVASVTAADISESPAKPAVVVAAETSVASVTVGGISESPVKTVETVSKSVAPSEPSTSTTANVAQSTAVLDQTLEVEEASNLVVSEAHGATSEPADTQLALGIPKQEPVTPQRQTKPPPTTNVVGLIQGFQSEGCFLAIPEQDQASFWTVRSYGAEPSSFDHLAEHLLEHGVNEVHQAKHTIQNIQCGAIEFAKSFAFKSTPGFKITLRQNQIQDGSDLNALIAGFDKQWLYVILVDDDGIATDVSRYAKAEGYDVRLTMPVHVQKAGKFRNQLLLVISSDHALTTLDFPKPTPLTQVLPLVKGNIIATKADISIAITDFSVD